MKHLSLFAALCVTLMLVATATSNSNFFIKAANTTASSSTTVATTLTSTTVVPTTTTPMPDQSCETFDNDLANCGVVNSTCFVFNQTCRAQCYFAWNGQAECDSWPHCFYDVGQSRCLTKCSAIVNNIHGCRATRQFCRYYGGRCNSRCDAGFFTNTSCEANRQCKWDTVDGACREDCSLAVNQYTCSADLGCRWLNDTQTCIDSCVGMTQQRCAAASRRCRYGRQTTKDWDQCMPLCSAFITPRDCTFNSNCMWNTHSKTCVPTCSAHYDNEAACTADLTCHFVNGRCSTQWCAEIFDTQSCINSDDMCQVKDDSTCVRKCSAANTSSSCPAFPLCNFSSATSKCDEVPCDYATSERACSTQGSCVWVGGMCKTSCDKIPQSYSQSVCNAVSYCEFDNLKYNCRTKCSAITVESACANANQNVRDPHCLWASAHGKCQAPCASHYDNASRCLATNACHFYNVPSAWGGGRCLPNCDMALSADECNSGFFSENCRWNYAGGWCAPNCAYQAIQNPAGGLPSCQAPCVLNTDFATCVLPRPATTTAAPTTTTAAPASTNASSSGSTSAVPSSTAASSTAAAPTNASSSAVAPSTTAATAPRTTIVESTVASPTTTERQVITTRAATTSEAPATTTSTAAPATTRRRRNPRCRFLLSAVARALTRTTASWFRKLLAKILGIPSNAMTVSYEESEGAMVVEFLEDAKDADGKTIDAEAEFEKAIALDTADMTSLGAAEASSMEPAPAPENPAPADDKPNLAVIIGAACGGLLFLLLILYVIKAKTSAGTGAAAAAGADAAVHDGRPMLEIPQNNARPSHTIDSDL